MGIHPLILKCFEKSDLNIHRDGANLKSNGHIVTDPSGSQWFTKTGRDVVQMRGEVEGLRAMERTCPGLVPRVLGFEVSQDGAEAGTVSQYFDMGRLSGREHQRELGRKLARMHTPLTSENGGVEGYGFDVPTHCGATEQDNTWEEDWEVFFRDRRLGNLVHRIGDSTIRKAWEGMLPRAIPLLLRDFDPPPKPVILHGDLWSGNAGFDKTTQMPVIFDPSSYYGHNEADLGITHMFGGFTREFYDEYHKHHPRSTPFYEERQQLYELYHHLNHALMFGGGYKSGALGIMRSLTSWADSVSREATFAQ